MGGKKREERVGRILGQLDAHYGPDHICYLHYREPWQLLMATILSAQCTDDRVNMVTVDLFQKYPTLEALASAPQEDIEEAVRSTGFYKNKASHLKRASIQLLERHGGGLPSGIEELTSLDGVGRKTANVVRGHIYNIESIVVDTHVKRISNKLGFTQNQDPVKIEFDLMELLPRSHWLRYNTQIIAHGRSVCTARNPDCGSCFLLADCPWGLRERLEKIT
ncbi:endonuclease III [Anaerotalea alkaliphila]|uniref:Endonuclease III n=1 Tax=Anaerotalea alkaliphila TaxID=2662126 RepID=A0A7X5HV51_9FIRM|nr:endonuclease III [Anaerotalea alkaliphila]NDL67230.1 endonuclease III [Anaerotalea alkaliphila]